MKKELSEKLLKKYPEFFDYLLPDQEIKLGNSLEEINENVHDLLKQESIVVPIQFGFECGDGWFFLLDTLMDEIKQYISRENEKREKAIKWKFWRETLFLKLRRLPYKLNWIWKLYLKIGEKLPKGIKTMPGINILQVKEKYGELCFYYNGGDNVIDGLVGLTESLSYKICEFCGTGQNVGHTQGWIVTCCKNCYENNKRVTNLIWEPIK